MSVVRTVWVEIYNQGIENIKYEAFAIILSNVALCCISIVFHCNLMYCVKYYIALFCD